MAMEKKVMELCESAIRGAEEAQIIDALDQLKNSPISSQILVSTQLVRRLLPLAKHPRNKIQHLASGLIVSWRNMFLEQMKRGEIQPVKAEDVDQNSLPSSSKELVIGFPQEKLTCMIPCNDFFRDKVRDKLYEGLSRVFDEVDEQLRDDVNKCDPIQIAVTIESLMFETWGGMNGPYEIKYRILLYLINYPNPPDFRRKVLLGHVSPEAVVQMRPTDMASDRQQRYNQELEEKRAVNKERYRERLMADLKEAVRDTYICGRCGHTKTNYKVCWLSRIPRDIVCLNCYQYWESADINYVGLLPIPEFAWF